MGQSAAGAEPHVSAPPAALLHAKHSDPGPLAVGVDHRIPLYDPVLLATQDHFPTQQVDGEPSAIADLDGTDLCLTAIAGQFTHGERLGLHSLFEECVLLKRTLLVRPHRD